MRRIRTTANGYFRWLTNLAPMALGACLILSLMNTSSLLGLGRVGSLSTVFSSNITKTKNGGGPSYLSYFASGGFGNQLQALTRAYYMARALDLTLVVLPVMPHLQPQGGLVMGHAVFGATNVSNVSSDSNPTVFDFRKGYLDAPRDKGYPYVPMSQILDMVVSFPGVDTIDFRDYAQNVLVEHEPSERNSKKITEWRINEAFDNTNTMWVRDRPDVEGKAINVTTWNTLSPRHKFREVVNVTILLRDIRATLLTEGSAKDADTLVVMDAFATRLDERSLQRPKFAPCYALSIRRLSEKIRGEEFHNLPYAAVHIRGSDGQFRDNFEPSVVNQQVNATKDLFVSQIRNNSATYTSTKEDISTLQRQEAELGLFIMTDVQNGTLTLEGKDMVKIVREGFDNLRSDMKARFNVTIQLFYSAMLPNYADILGSMPDANNFVEQQLAVEAPLGFVPFPVSTFSEIVSTMRKNTAGGCA